VSVFVRTSRSTGVSVPWIVAPFLLLGVVTYWLMWLVVMSFVWAVRFSVKAVALAYAICSTHGPGDDAQRPPR